MSKLKSGFSLVEVLVFLFLVSVMATTLLASAGNYAKTRGVNSEGIAAKIASCDIEQLRNTNFSSLSNGTVDVPSPCNQDLSKLTQASAQRTITSYQSDPAIKQVIVSVDWTQSAIAQNVKLETLIGEYGL